MEQAQNADLRLAQLFFDNHWLTHARRKCRDALASSLDDPSAAQALALAVEQRLEDPSALNLSRDHTPITILMEKQCIISTLHFRHLESERLKQEAFRQAVYYIDIETSSQCNRTCHYCPNSQNDRISSNSFLEDNKFKGFVNDLGIIDYRQELHFVGFNEPLLFMDNILAKIVLARKSVPRAKIVVFTNGDYLKPEGLDQLIAAGTDELIISVHLPLNRPYSDESIFTRINKIAKRLGTPITPLAYVKDTMISARLVHSGIAITIRQTDYERLGSNRAATLDAVGEQIETRTAACLMPIYQFIVGHQGAVVPCCVMVSDDPRNAKFIVGRLQQAPSIFDIYCNRSFVEWRRSLFNLAPKNAPCEKCNWEVSSSLLNAPVVYEPWQHLVSPQHADPVVIG